MEKTIYFAQKSNDSNWVCAFFSSGEREDYIDEYGGTWILYSKTYFFPYGINA